MEKESGRHHWHWSHGQDPEHVGQEQGGLSIEQGEMMGVVLGNLLGFEFDGFCFLCEIKGKLIC